MSDEVPNRRKSIVRAVQFFAGFFFVAGIAALVVGLHDVTLHSSGLGVLFPAILLLLVGAIFVGAAWRLIPIARSPKKHEEEPPCEQPVPLAFLVSILFGIYVFFGALAGNGVQRGTVIAVSLVFIAAGALGFGLFWGDIEVSAVRVGATVALTVVGLLVGVWEFWYQNQYRPSHLDRAVSVQVSLKKLRTQKGYDLLSASLRYEDIGGRAGLVLGSAYTLTGSTVVACPRPATPKSEAGVFGGELLDPQRSRFMSSVWEMQPATILAAGKLAPDARRLAPDAPASRQLILYVPHNRYQLLRLRAQVLAVSASVPLNGQPPTKVPITGKNDVYELWKLRGSSWFQDLVSGSSDWIVTRYELVSPDPKANQTVSAPDVRVTALFPKPTWSGSAPTSAQIKNLFKKEPPPSATETFADAELPLKPVAPPTASQSKKLAKTCPRHAATKRESASGTGR